jgi:hypothetical protein
MLASFPASMVNQNRSDLGILNRFNITPSRFSNRGQNLLSHFGEAGKAVFAVKQVEYGHNRTLALNITVDVREHHDFQNH